jgi:hypothetical protein
MPTTDNLLDLQGVGQRSVSYRWELLDKDEMMMGELHPLRDEGMSPVITHDRARAVMRDISGFNLVPYEANHVNTLTDRIRPVMLMEDGTEHPLGVFLFAEASAPVHSYGKTLSSTLVDKGLILDQPLERSVTIASGTFARDGIASLLAGVGVEAIVDSSSSLVGAAMSWPPGTTRLQVITDLGAATGYMPPFFHHTGHCHVHQFINPETRDIQVSYADGKNIYASSPVESNDLLRTPNRFIVIGTDPTTDAAIVGIYDVPATAPFSFEQRGIRIVEVVDHQGIENVTAAATVVKNWALSRQIFEYISFLGPPDPRHDGHTVVEYNGVRWLENVWSLPCTPYGPMSHTLQKIYVDEEGVF